METELTKYPRNKVGTPGHSSLKLFHSLAVGYSLALGLERTLTASLEMNWPKNKEKFP